MQQNSNYNDWMSYKWLEIRVYDSSGSTRGTNVPWPFFNSVKIVIPRCGGL